jgi:hypothetical protein
MSTVISTAAVESYRAIYQCAAAGIGSSTPQVPPATSDQTPASSSASSTFQANKPSPSDLNNNSGILAESQSASGGGQQAVSLVDPRIMCCIPQTDQVYLFAQLPKRPLRLSSDREFFEDLKREYHESRGRLRSRLGLSCVSRITFLRVCGSMSRQADLSQLIYSQFSRTRIRLGQDYADCHGPEGVPPDGDPAYNVYHYSPKPPDKPPVIPEFKLLHYFKNPECPGIPTCGDFLKKIPKRDGELPDDQDIAWGLQLQLNLCPTRISVLFLLFWLSSWGFFCWWMSERPWDIQSGAVPATVVAVVATLLLAIFPAHIAHYQNLPRQ